jgi:hypothetical protein
MKPNATCFRIMSDIGLGHAAKWRVGMGWWQCNNHVRSIVSLGGQRLACALPHCFDWSSLDCCSHCFRGCICFGAL